MCLQTFTGIFRYPKRIYNHRVQISKEDLQSQSTDIQRRYIITHTDIQREYTITEYRYPDKVSNHTYRYLERIYNHRIQISREDIQSQNTYIQRVFTITEYRYPESIYNHGIRYPDSSENTDSRKGHNSITECAKVQYGKLRKSIQITNSAVTKLYRYLINNLSIDII